MFSKKYDVFLINIVVKYKIKKGYTICSGKGLGDGVRKRLIWMGHKTLIRSMKGTPQYLQINEKLSEVMFIALGRKVKYQSKKQFNTKY